MRGVLGAVLALLARSEDAKWGGSAASGAEGIIDLRALTAVRLI